MKLTLQLRSFLEEQVIAYSKELRMDPPFVVFTDEELKEIEPSQKIRKKEQKEKLGISWAKGNVLPDRDVIWLNVENSDYLWQMIDIVVHELLHLKCPAQEHDTKEDECEFQDIINSIIMGKRN